MRAASTGTTLRDLCLQLCACAPILYDMWLQAAEKDSSLGNAATSPRLMTVTDIQRLSHAKPLSRLAQLSEASLGRSTHHRGQRNTHTRTHARTHALTHSHARTTHTRARTHTLTHARTH